MSIGHPTEIHDYFTNAVNQHVVHGRCSPMYDPGGVAVQLDSSEATGWEAIPAMSEGLVGAMGKSSTSTSPEAGVVPGGKPADAVIDV